MKKRLVPLAVVLILALCLVAGFSYFHVSGKEIANMAIMDETCEVEITKYDIFAREDSQQYVLEAPQIAQLKQLLLESSFTRRLPFSNAVSHDSTFYSVSIYFHDRQDVLFLNCVGGDSMTVYSSLDTRDDLTLKINNKNWKTALENILQSASIVE